MSDVPTTPATPAAAATPEQQWTNVGQASEWPENGGKLVQVGARRIGVYHHADGWYALKDTCPHAGVPLHRGPVFEGAVMCIGHGWRFSLTTGELVGQPSYKVATYPVRVREGAVEIAV